MKYEGHRAWQLFGTVQVHSVYGEERGTTGRAMESVYFQQNNIIYINITTLYEV
jgi:hypothetical protein